MSLQVCKMLQDIRNMHNSFKLSSTTNRILILIQVGRQQDMDSSISILMLSRISSKQEFSLLLIKRVIWHLELQDKIQVQVSTPLIIPLAQLFLLYKTDRSHIMEFCRKLEIK